MLSQIVRVLAVNNLSPKFFRENTEDKLLEVIYPPHMTDVYGNMPIGAIVETVLINGKPPVEKMPYGFFYCDGSKFDKERYPLLYAFLQKDTLPNVPNTDTICHFIKGDGAPYNPKVDGSIALTLPTHSPAYPKVKQAVLTLTCSTPLHPTVVLSYPLTLTCSTPLHPTVVLSYPLTLTCSTPLH